MSKKFISIAVLKSKANKREELLTALLQLIDPTRSEMGCLEYTLFEDKENLGTFYMREAFEDEEAFKFHTGTSHFRAFERQVDNLMDHSIDLIKLNQVSH